MQANDAIFDLIDLGNAMIRQPGTPIRSARDVFAMSYVHRRLMDAKAHFDLAGHTDRENITAWVEEFIADPAFHDLLVVNGIRFEIQESEFERRIVRGNYEDQVLVEWPKKPVNRLGRQIRVSIHPLWTLFGVEQLTDVDYDAHDHKLLTPADVSDVIQFAINLYSTALWEGFSLPEINHEE